MGIKYATKSASGYNSSPPSDDGSQSASNLITWAKHKTKLGDPVKNLADDINTALVSAFDYSVRQITASDSTVAGDHMKCIEIAPTVTTAVTITLGDATTMTNNYRVFVKNSSARNQTLGLVTALDTLDGSAGGTVTLPPKSGLLVQTNNAANGYLIVSRYGLFPDGEAVVSGGTDGTKKVRFEVDGLTTGTTRVLTVQDSDDTLVGRATTDTLTNKTLSAASNTLNLTPITNSMSGDVTLNNTANFFDGPSVAQGTSGTWFVSGTVTMIDTTAASTFIAKLWDGTTIIASAESDSRAANAPITISLSGYIASPAANLRISVRDTSNATGVIKQSLSGVGKDSTISAFRIA